MNTFRNVALVGTLLLGFGATAHARPLHPAQWLDSYGFEPFATGRSVYVDRAPQTAGDANQIVMGLRVPNGVR